MVIATKKTQLRQVYLIQQPTRLCIIDLQTIIISIDLSKVNNLDSVIPGIVSKSYLIARGVCNQQPYLHLDVMPKMIEKILWLNICIHTCMYRCKS